MTAVEWPNAISPGLWPFRLDAPEQWSAVEPHEALIAFLAPPADGFRANLVVFGRRLPEDLTLGEVAELALSDDAPRRVVDPGIDQPAAPGGLPVAVRSSGTVVEGREVRQIAVVTEASDRSPAGLRSVYTMLGTYLAGRTDPDESTLTSVMASFELIR
ncbi:hypothetical protein ACQSSU_18200 [Micromonospora echinospora]